MKFSINDIPFVRSWLAGEDAFTFHTSGSTGNPQAITVTRTQIEASVRATQKALHLTEKDVALICLPTQYTAGLMMLARCLVIGMKPILVSPSKNPFEELPPEIQPTFMAVVPLQLQYLLQQEAYLDKLDRMKAILVGGAPLSQTLIQATRHRRVPIWATYGMTETVSHIALQKLNGSGATTAYTVLPDIQIGVDEAQCLKICGAVTRHEWIVTRDIARLSDDGKQFVILGRADNIINSAGIKIQPEIVENAIYSFLSERDANMTVVVSAIPDETLGEKLVLVVENIYKNTFAQEELFSYLKNKLSSHQIPKQILYVDALPKTETDKINRKALKESLKK